MKKVYLKQALQVLGYACEDGAVEIRGFGGKRTPVELRILTGTPITTLVSVRAAAYTSLIRYLSWPSCAAARLGHEHTLDMSGV